LPHVHLALHLKQN